MFKAEKKYKTLVTPWVVPQTSDKGKWRFIGIPYSKWNDPGGDYYWEGGQPKSHPSKMMMFFRLLTFSHLWNVCVTWLFVFFRTLINSSVATFFPSLPGDKTISTKQHTNQPYKPYTLEIQHGTKKSPLLLREHHLPNLILGGGFKYFLFSPLFGEESHFD